MENLETITGNSENALISETRQSSGIYQRLSKTSMSGILVLSLLSGCTGMPHLKVEGFEDLKVTEHKVNPVEVAFYCTKAMGMPAFMALLLVPLACATVNMKARTCDIYYSAITAIFSLEHEREHCIGYWHDDGLEKYRNNWRSNQERDL